MRKCNLTSMVIIFFYYCLDLFNIADDEFCSRFRSNVCRSLLLFCAISSGKEARDSVTGSYILYVSLIVIAFLVFFSVTVIADYISYISNLLDNGCLQLTFVFLVLSNLLDNGCSQLTFVFLVLPCLLLGYLGQAAYLMENPGLAAEQAFFSSIPSKPHHLSQPVCK